MPSFRKGDFSDIYLYAVSSEVSDEIRFLKQVEGLLAGGVDCLQLRVKEKSDRDILSLGEKVKALCQEEKALFILNNRVDLALALDADGVHLGHTDLPISQARELLGHKKIIGASTHSLPQALEAQKSGADYVSCGPIWATPTKPEYEPVGLGLIGLYKAALRIPFVAIGGINENNIDQVLQAGASRVAVVRALFEATQPKTITEKFKEKIEGVRLNTTRG